MEREYSDAYAPVSPQEGALVSLRRPEGKAQLRSVFLAEGAQRYLCPLRFVVLAGAGRHRAKDLGLPAHRRLEARPARSPELNLAEHLGDERGEKW